MYFSKFPKLEYSSTGSTADGKIVTHLLRRVAIKQSLDDDMKLMDDYFVKEGETPENLSHKHFGSAKYHWVILMTNNVTDRYYQWPMTQPQFDEFLTDKYGAGNEDAIHHYEITKSSGKTSSSGPNDYSHLVEVNSDTDNASSISNREYEERLQDKYRSIKLLDRRYLSDFLEEFDNLIAQQ